MQCRLKLLSSMGQLMYTDVYSHTIVDTVESSQVIITLDVGLGWCEDVPDSFRCGSELKYC